MPQRFLITAAAVDGHGSVGCAAARLSPRPGDAAAPHECDGVSCVRARLILLARIVSAAAVSRGA
eukprot:5222338-Prymnesium_polylepis.1